jgi:transcriptional regulator with XRE-family HTH domain
MNHREYVTERETRDAEFRAERDALESEYEFRRALIAARIGAGLTQKELAERMNTTQSTIARLEAGARMPRLDTLSRLASVLGVTFDISPNRPLALRSRRGVQVAGG